MGNCINVEVTCPKCKIASFNLSRQNVNDVWQHIDQCYQIKCPNCPTANNGFVSGHSFYEHLTTVHGKQLSGISTGTLTCPKCYMQNIITEEELINHYHDNHAQTTQPDLIDIVCPVCYNSGFRDGVSLVKHLEMMHSVVLPPMEEETTIVVDDDLKQKLPKAGDRIISMWGQSKWQYFHAKIKRFIKDMLKYEIDWDDGDTTGRIVDYFNIALDRIPDENELGVGTIVLFPQGSYEAGQTQVTGGKRWHQGRITSVYPGPDGKKLYNGVHTKSTEDGKFCTYKDYSPNFISYSRHDFRLAPNVFDVIAEDNNDADGESMDVYISYNLVDSHIAVQNHEVKAGAVPESYQSNYHNMCDPADIEKFLRDQGFNVTHSCRSGNHDLKQVAAMMKKSKMFVACISDQYVNDDQCRMEFQYAKTSLRKPVIPLVVGDGSFNWTASVVGMLIAGELFIHFRDKEIENDKNQELLSNIKKHLSTGSEVAHDGKAEIVTSGPADVFLSYCWTNSQKAEHAKQISKANGSSLSDPRLLKEKIAALGYKVWLDIEQLESANADAGLFGQIAEGLKNAKVVIPCVSDEYSKSQNCRMEFQFALKSLYKPSVPIVVGNGNEWKKSVVGALMATHDSEPIDLQNVEEDSVLESKMEQLKICIEKLIGTATDNNNITAKQTADISETPTTAQWDSRAPKVGDHVVSHHQSCAYFMATVVGFDCTTMRYTVDWDDGDPSGKEQPFNQVAIDVSPEEDDIGVGSIVFFNQGSYGATEGNNTGGFRYHEGEVTDIKRLSDGQILVSGHHTKGEDDGKWVTYKAYSYYFDDISLSEIRLAPTALEAIIQMGPQSGSHPTMV